MHGHLVGGFADKFNRRFWSSYWLLVWRSTSRQSSHYAEAQSADRHTELVAESSRSFALFAEAVVELAREHGWPRNRVQLVAHSAWAMEHGLATLILGDRVRNIAQQAIWSR